MTASHLAGGTSWRQGQASFSTRQRADQRNKGSGSAQKFVYIAGGLALALTSSYYLQKPRQETSAQAESEASQESQRVAEGDRAIKQFTKNYPDAANVGAFYDELSPEGYDEWARQVNFCEPYYIVDEVARLVKNSDKTVGKQKMLDVGAGTGLLGLKLREKAECRDILDITGIDASKQFVAVLNDSEAYAEAREIWMGRGTDEFPTELKEQFDIVTASGVFLKGHIPAPAMDDIHAALKPDGHFVTAMRSLYYERGVEEGYREKLDELVDSGKLRLVRTETFMRGREGQDGLFSPQESRLLCYQKRG